MTNLEMMKDNLKQDKKIYSVSEITRDIRGLLEGAFTKVWVEGEISNLTMHSSGHCYFSIKDENSVLSCVMFKNSAYKLKFKIEDGMSIVCFGRVSVYDKRGQYQLYVEVIEPKGIGSLQLAFTQLKEKLLQEGLFDDSHKKPIPYLPEKIGIVTSKTGAAIKDMIHVIERRFPKMYIILYPTKVQGDGAAENIAEGIRAFNLLGDVDVIIIGRGGGSIEDLWAFNEEVTARAIYESSIPVISAVGHEVDYTISDFVADLRAPTPSAAAELVVPRKEDVLDNIDSFKQKLKIALKNSIDMAKKHLDGIMKHHAFKTPQVLMQQHQQKVDEYTKALKSNLSYFVNIKKRTLDGAKGKLDALSPVAILQRGYSITMTYPENDIIKDASKVKSKTRIKTRLGLGEIISRVE